MTVKLTDIAEQAGVSIATVSRVIRKGQADSSPSCQRILEIVKEMGYKPNRVRKPKGIGNVLFAILGIPQDGTSDDPIYSVSSFYGVFLYSVEKEVRKYQGTLTVCHAEKDVDDVAAWIRQTARDSGSRGIITLGKNISRRDLDAIPENLPIVNLNAVPGVTDVDSVAPDDEGGIRQVVRRLVELGHRRIAFWADRDAAGRVIHHTVPRLRGYHSGLEEAGLTYSRIYSEEVGDWPFLERMERGFQAYLADPERPTAIVCAGDGFAHHVLRLVLKHGISVPRQVSIFGFDDSEFNVHSHPQLSSVNIQRVWMSREAVRLVARRLSDPECLPCQVTVQARVVERETCGPAAT